MNARTFWLVLWVAAVAVAIFVLADPTSVLAGPLDSITNKANDARDQVVTVGKAFIGLVAAVLFVLAATGKVSWYWVGMVVIAGAGLQGLQSIQSWLNS
jgi:hypothetical protein